MTFNLSRFANPNRTDVLPLGPCQCPGTPHTEGDIAVYRLELGSGEESRAGAYGWSITNGVYFDWEAARSKLIEIGVVRWNLLGPDGEPMPVTVISAGLLDEKTRNAIAAKLDEVTSPPLPKASKRRSPRRSLVNGSHIQKVPKPSSSTTSSSPLGDGATTN